MHLWNRLQTDSNSMRDSSFVKCTFFKHKKSDVLSITKSYHFSMKHISYRKIMVMFSQMFFYFSKVTLKPFRKHSTMPTSFLCARFIWWKYDMFCKFCKNVSRSVKQIILFRVIQCTPYLNITSCLIYGALAGYNLITHWSQNNTALWNVWQYSYTY